MSWSRFLIVVLAGIGANFASVRAEEFRSVNQMPGMIAQDAARVILANIGTAALNISYLDGVWKTIQIPSGEYVPLPSQSTGLSLSFNNGAEAQLVTLNPGTIYALYWNSGLNRWAIAPYDEVARRPSGFRSR
jgi:hypothetical protein